MNVGYAIVSTSSQNLENQINQLKSVCCKKIFSEKRSEKNESNREQFKLMIDFVREGDILYIAEFERDLIKVSSFMIYRIFSTSS
jgi:DNA invertase Pin-like site-specific DNA recombinase